MLTTRDEFTDLLHLDTYSSADVGRLKSILHVSGTFYFPALPSGLYPAANLCAEAGYTGYDNVWVRDNVHIAHALLETGDACSAVRCILGLNAYFTKYSHRFESIILGHADPQHPQNRPHVRFNPETLDENPEEWSHAQNDALGYFLWLFCKLAHAGHIGDKQIDWQILGLFPLYFQAIEFWRDEDSGHWEEAPKIEASSIGAVLAGLRDLRRLMVAHSLCSIPCLNRNVSLTFLDALLDSGFDALSNILPFECVQEDVAKRRRYDAALLFLIYPLQIVDDPMADIIVRDVNAHLLGEHGVRRYKGDSFWCADYKLLQSPELRTANVSSDMSTRNALLRSGEEAQWCIFDPILSVIHGQRFLQTKERYYLEQQIRHMRRSLSQLTTKASPFPAFLCPELYYLENGTYTVNDVTPLLWTQANLSIALQRMSKSAATFER